MKVVLFLFGSCSFFFASESFSVEQIKISDKPEGIGVIDDSIKKVVANGQEDINNHHHYDIEVLEKIITTPSKNQDKVYPESLVSPINFNDKTQIPSTLTELINTSPSVSQNGQGGHFQNFSIRGVSKHRIKTVLNGVRIESDRRAGVSASFIDPLLIGDASVWRTPASTQFGSGALGGAVQIDTYRFTSFQAMAGYSSLGDEYYQVLGNGDDNYSVGFARREAGNAEAADGEELNTHFTQYSAIFSALQEWQGLTLDIFVLPALALDVGKSNSDFPSRITNYPEEKHLLFNVGVRSDRGWSSRFYIHPNELKTNVHKIKKSVTNVSNSAFNMGGNWQIEKSIGNLTGLVGVDYFGRKDINIKEKSVQLSSGKITRSRSLQGGEENEFGLFGTFNWQWQRAEILAGTRFSYFNQTQKYTATENDTAWSGFVGVSYPFKNGLSLSINFASGFRFPSLSERFFTGTTGRGRVIGNSNLETEHSMNLDIGAKWVGSSLTVAANIFYLQVRDYIERVEISENVLSFVNLKNGRIMGLELENSYLINEQLSFTWSGHLLEGRDDKGNVLSDIPSNGLLLGLKYKTEQWESAIELEMRAKKNDPGNGEKKIGSSQLLSAVIRYRPSHNLLYSISGSNLLNEEYFSSADKKASYAVERSIGLNVSWQM